MAPKKNNTAAQLPVGTKLHMLGSANPTSFKITAATSANPPSELIVQLVQTSTNTDSPVPRTCNDIAAAAKTPSSTTSYNHLTPPPSCKKLSGPNLLENAWMNSTFEDVNGKKHSMDKVAWPSPPPCTLGKRTRDKDEIERAEKRLKALAGSKIDPVAAALFASEMQTIRPSKSKVAAPSGRPIAPLVKYTEKQLKADIEKAKVVLGTHYRTLRIITKKVRGQDKLTVDYFLTAYNRDFLDILRQTNEKGKQKLIAMAVDMLIDRLAEIEKEKECIFDYHSFESQYQDALHKLTTGSGSAHNIKRTIKNADDAAAIIAASEASKYGKPKGLVKARLVDYRLVWPACVFKMAWMCKDYKMQDGSGANCFKAAGFMLEAVLNGVGRRRRLVCSGHQEWYCGACPGDL